jgi:hypothetical protein
MKLERLAAAIGRAVVALARFNKACAHAAKVPTASNHTRISGILHARRAAKKRRNRACAKRACRH